MKLEREKKIKWKKNDIEEHDLAKKQKNATMTIEDGRKKRPFKA